MSLKPLISFTGIVWDPEELSYNVRRVLAFLSQFIGMPLSKGQLDEFQKAVILTTPMNYSQSITGRSSIRYPDGTTAVYDNGVNLDTKEGMNIPSLVFTNADEQICLLAAGITCCKYVWTGTRSFRLFFNDEKWIVGRGHILQRPPPEIPGEGIIV